MTLQQLEYLVALDEHRQFVSAARACFVTQPTLTMQVKKLEQELGVIVFDRSRTPTEPTPVGEKVIEKARQILRETRQLRELVVEEKDAISGIFKLAVIPTLAPYVLPSFIGKFTALNPDTYLQIREMQSDEIIDGLKKDTVDLGLLVTPLNERQIREVPLFHEPFLLYLQPGHPLSQQERVSATKIDPQEILLLDKGHCFRSQILKICQKKKATVNKGFDYQSGSIEALMQMVERGMGYTLVPEMAVLDKLGLSSVKRFEEPEPAREVSICVHKSFAKEQLIDKLRQSILDVIPDRFVKNEKYIKVEWR